MSNGEEAIRIARVAADNLIRHSIFAPFDGETGKAVRLDVCAAVLAAFGCGCTWERRALIAQGLNPAAETFEDLTCPLHGIEPSEDDPECPHPATEPGS